MFSRSTQQNAEHDKWSYYLLLALAVVLPLAVCTSAAVPPAMTKMFAGGVFILLSLVAFSVATMRTQTLSVPKLLLIPAAWLLPLMYLLSTLFSVEGAMTVYGERLTMDSTAFMTLAAVVLTLAATVLATPKRALGVYLAMLGSAALLTVFELVLFLARDAVASTGMIFTSLSLLGTLNDLAVFFGLIVVFTILSLLLLSASMVVRVVLWLVLAAAAFFLAVVNLTVLWWILGIFAVGTFVYSVSGALRGSVRTVASQMSGSSLAIIVLAGFFVVGSQAATTALAEKLQVGELDVRPSWQTTVELGKETLSESMLFGTGPGSFVYTWAAHMPAEIAETAFWQADFAYGIGLVPTAVVSTGLLGTLAWFVFLGFFIYYGVRSFMRMRGADTGDVVTYIRVTSFVGALYLWIIAVIQVPSPVLMLYAFLLTGVFVASLTYGSDGLQRTDVVFEDSPKIGFLVTLLLTFTLLVSVSGVYNLSKRFMAEVSFQKALVALTQDTDLDAGEELLDKAIARHPTDAYYRYISNVDIVRIRELLAQDRTPEEVREQFQNLLARAIANAQQATDLDKRDYQNWVNLGTLYQAVTPLGIDGAADSANAAFDQALELRPSSPSVFLAKATLARAQGSNDEARALVEEAVALRNRYTDARFLLAQIQLEEQNVTEAIASVEAITVFEPRNPVAFFQLGLLQYGSEDFAAAVGSLETAVALNPVYANARYFLGLSYWKLGQNDAAVTQFRAVQNTNPDNEEVKSIIDNLQSGRDPFADLNVTDEIENLEGLPVLEDGAAPDTLPEPADLVE